MSPPAGKENKDNSNKKGMGGIQQFMVPRSRYGRVRAPVNYTELDDVLDDEKEEKEEEQAAPKKKNMSLTNGTARGGTKRKRAASTSSSEVIPSSDEEESSQEEEEEEEEEAPPKKIKRTSAKKSPAASANTKEAGKKVSMADAFQPINHPLFQKLSRKEIAQQKEFLDPCGMEATDNIIGSLMGQQVDKVRHLLEKALSNDQAIGSQKTPLKLGTACSGTDAPALALAMIQEQLRLRSSSSSSSPKDDLFHYQHVFSCEMEPFKQAYLARNFDSILYPDITKLVLPNNQIPTDVYGQAQRIPVANMFVAGTSCKNFSTLMTKFRIDIEDHGCSGDTFLAACEVLFQERPQYAILENVITAPWEKMSEYITGRVVLKSCDSKKAVKEIKSKTQELEFVWDSNKQQILVHRVSEVFGVRCGSAIQGYETPSRGKTIQKVEWPKAKKKNASCTLKELMQENKINKQTDTLVFHMPVTYCAHFTKVDSKNFGVPQTRQRTYMFVWQPSVDTKGNSTDEDLGKYWEAVVKHLQSPVRHSLEAFILQVDHDIIRVFREALRGPPGRQSRRAAFQLPDFWTSASKNLGHNKVARERSQIDDMARPVTKWGAFGKKLLPPHYWLEYLNCQNQREIDMLDILHISAARDAESHDSNFSSFFWNISQNASKEKHRTACPGIAGCITPGGDVFLPHLGRPLLGCEKLLLQGIPYFSLALGNESEVQLSDLAGNAMTLTTVGATLLAAMTCRQLRKETMESKHNDMNKILNLQVNTPSSKQNSELVLPKQLNFIDEEEGHASISDLFRELVGVLSEAVTSSIWCTCETSGQNSSSAVFLTCLCCRISSCRECCGSTAGYQMDGHNVHEVVLDYSNSNNKRLVVGAFENKLRNLLPALLYFNKSGLQYVAQNTGNDHHRVKGLIGSIFSLHRIRRQRRKWIVTYYARDHSNQAVAELRMSVGEVVTTEVVTPECIGSDTVPTNNLGVLCEFTSFLPAKTVPLRYGPLDPCIYKQMILKPDGLSVDESEWMVRGKDTTVDTLIVEGTSPTPSFRKEVGLTDDAEMALKAHVKKSTTKSNYEKACQLGEQRRFIYAENWKVWPAKITVRSHTDQNFVGSSKTPQSSHDVSGTYERSCCRNTIAQSGLWIRKDVVPSMYLLIKPNISRTGPDTAIISTSLNHEETICIVAHLPIDWQPCDALKPKLQMVRDVKFANWFAAPVIKCFAPKSNIQVSAPEAKVSSKELLKVSGLADADLQALCRSSTPCQDGHYKLHFSGSQDAQQSIRIFNSICVTPLLKYAAEHGLSYDLSPDAAWTSLEQNTDVYFGCCETTIPRRPEEHWYRDEERQSWERRSDPGASRRYYLALQAAPQAFELLVNRTQGYLQVNVLPEVVCHHAAHQLISGRGEGLEREVVVHFRLSSLLSQVDPKLDMFKVYSCDEEEPTFVQLQRPHKLYARQQKALTKMLAIENRETSFEEIEMSEHSMPGDTGWSVTAKATRMTAICGGVIADAIGSGKTVVSIAIILSGLKAARNGRSFPRKSSATLVVVPPGLIDQWDSEIKKFSDSLKVICIYDLNALKKVTVQSMIEADVVICPVDILESPMYLANLLEKSKETEGGAPKLPAYVGQTETSVAQGVWIPSSSTDPYGGGNNPNNQKRRNESARYTYVYLKAIESLRSLSFDKTTKSIPLEYFEWERVIVDEIHECLCTSKDDMKLAKQATAEDNRGFFQEKNRRAGRELLGVMTKDTRQRPLVYRKAIFGLTGTPLLDSTNRVVELASLMGNTYVIGLSSHWRKLERESRRDIFLHNFLEPKTSREIRRQIYVKCQQYLKTACCRNKSGEEMTGIDICYHLTVVKMSHSDGEAYLKSQNGIPSYKQSYSIQPADFDASSGHDISVFLRQNANLSCRSKALVKLCKDILQKDPTTKILVFCDGRIAAGSAAVNALATEGLGCTYLALDDTVQQKNKKIAWYQHADVTEEDKGRPRVLVLNFEHAAGLNLQTECYNLILFTPLYIGVGGSSDDPVWDSSTEQQAIGRVYRPGQPSKIVNVYRIEVKGPDGEECLDTMLIRRNTDPETLEMATNTSD